MSEPTIGRRILLDMAKASAQDAHRACTHFGTFEASRVRHADLKRAVLVASAALADAEMALRKAQLHDGDEEE